MRKLSLLKKWQLAKLMLVFCLNFTLFSCSKEDVYEKDVFNDMEVNELVEILFYKYTSIENSRLVLTESDEFFLERGIDDNILNSFKANLASANTLIEDYLIETKASNETVDMRIADPIDEQNVSYASTTAPHGMIDTRYGDVNENSFFAPYNMLGVNCTIISPTPHAVHIVITHAMTNLQDMRFGVGNLVVPLAAANCQATITYLTTDSNGGLCSWVGLLAQ